ncbi:Zinc finger protein Xfin [Armadillidium nasatum]|uniref:Zinc finger protein Xfin n=1 Tax=Armadillidium nasatum TaxID=96803 RepID=A0A5N5SMG8_9CRUS|nr:Zinc finger protein Xfin [Armadillidium nasatum]
METVTQNLVLTCRKANQSPGMIEKKKLEKSPSSLRKQIDVEGNKVDDEISNQTSHYIAETKQTVTILYPQSGLPLLSTNNGELVNLVELPNVEDVDPLHLENSLQYQVLGHNFENGSQIAVVTTDQSENQLLEAHTIQSAGEESIAYFKSANVEAIDNSNVRENTLISEQLIIPASEVVSNGQTITLPLSFVNDSGGVSLLQGLSHLPITLGDDSSGEVVPVNIETSSLVSGSENDSPSYIISNISSPISQQEVCSSIVNSSKSKNANICKSNSSKGILKVLKSNHVGRPPKTQHKKVIGYGPAAISAQGVVQEIGNRLVTVLPRPEDLKKLIDNKQLVLTVKGSNSSRFGNKKLNGSVKSQLNRLNNIYKKGSDDNTSLSENVSNINGISNNDEDIHDEDFCPKPIYVKRKGRRRKRGKRRGKGTFVISSTGRKLGRPKKVRTIVEGPKGPRVIQTGTNSTMSVSSNNDEVTQIEQSTIEITGNNYIRRTFNISNIKLENIDDSSLHSESEEYLRDKYTEEKTLVNEEGKRKLPPRNRGSKYKKLMLALKKQEYSDDDFDDDDSESGSINGGFNLSRTPLIPVKPKGHSKRGRPRKYSLQEEIVEPSSFTSTPTATIQTSLIPGLGSTKIIQLNESLSPIGEDVNSPTVLVKDEFHNPLEEENATIFVEENGEYEEGYQCTECGETTLYKRDYIRHLRVKHNLRPYECEHCGKTFTSKTSLQNHVQLHGLEKLHRCNQCGKGFDSVSQLKSHAIDHAGDNFYDCEHCGKAFSDISSLDLHHISSHYESVYNKCTKCNTVVSPEEYISHNANCFSFSKCYECDICHLQFVSSSGLNRHRKVHSRSSNPGLDEPGYRCSTCQASFSFESSLVKHVKIVHSLDVDTGNKSMQTVPLRENSVIEQLQEKLNEGYAPKTSELYDEPEETETIEKSSYDPFKCGICDEPFKDIDVMCDHYSSSHMGDQLNYCSYCGVGCSSESQLEQHKLIHVNEEKLSLSIIDSKDTPYVCSACGKGLRTSQEFAKHTKVHTQDKQFKCTLCSASFLIKSALDKHILVHTGQRPYVCDICLKSFRQSAALVRHKLWTHRLKNQNKCEVCGKTFFTESLLLYHLDSHGEEAAELKIRILNKSSDDNHSMNEKDLQTELEPKSSDEPNKKRTCEYCNKECSSLVALLTHKITHKLSASFKCDICHRTFREKRYLKKHKLTHKGLKVWKCDICHKAFATKLTLIRHSHVHLREALKPDPISYIDGNENCNAIVTTSVNTLPNELKCVECNREFVHKSHYVRHKLLHSGIPLLKCGLCNKMFVHKSDIIRHKVMHSFMFTCNLCGRNFHKRTLYVLHMKKHMDAKPFKCDKCNKSFASSGNFKIHQRIHSGEKPYHCNICNYKCSQSGRLLKHKRMHYGEKSASCNLCGKSFSNSESLKSHQRIHTGERPFRCSNCSKSFTNSTSLNQHMRDHVKEEMFKCEECHHKFRRSEHLEKHKMFHKVQHQFQKNTEMGLEADANIETPLYMCEICGRVFEKKKYLYTHHNVHSRQKLYSCAVCGKHLASRLALRNHTMIHTGEMPHKCNYCDKVFRSLSNLKRHVKVHSYNNQEFFSCDECGETLYTLDMLNEHKQAHVNLMMMNSADTGSVSNEVNQQLYVFDSVDDNINDTMNPNQQLIVENSQQQFLVDNTQSLLVFPESGNETYTEISSHTAETIKTEQTDVVPSSPLSNDDDIDQNTQSPFVLSHDKTISSLPVVEEREIDKPHQCDVCFKNFAKKQYLTKHKYRHREIKPHACDICEKRFAQKFEVAVHKIKHTGERPYCCEICKKEFRSKVNLINHRMRHTGEYPYLCSVCNKGLSTQLQLERHVSLHTGAHPFRCDICNKGYFQSVSLKRHLAKGHNIQTVDNYDPSHGIESSENLEVMEAISTIANISSLNEEKHTMVKLVTNKKIKEEVDLEVNVETMDMTSMEDFDVHGQQDYLLEPPQEIDPKFLSSILQQVPVDEADCVESSVNNDDQD